jgi:hypothetical protein
MTARIEIPFLPRPNEPRGGHVEPPVVSIKARWDYKELVRTAESGHLLTEAELNKLGTEGWELAGVANEGGRVRFYFKREQAR